MPIQFQHLPSEKDNSSVQLEHTDCKNSDKHVTVPETQQGVRWYQNRYRQYQLFFGSALIILLIKLIWMMNTFYITELTDDVQIAYPEESTTAKTSLGKTTFNDSTVNNSFPTELKLISRQEWLAHPPINATEMSLPVPFVIIAHTATRNCSDFDMCTYYVRTIQRFHQETREWDDIGYNFLVGGDGSVYEGTGWKFVGAHTYGYNSRSIGIAFIGNFDRLLPPEKQITAAKQLIQEGVEEGYIAANYKLFAARQLHPTVSPGLQLYRNIKRWPHWHANP